jgi:hypothetical protein
MRKKDAVLLTYFCGLLTMISLLLVVMLIIPAENGEEFHRHNAWSEIFASLYTFRFLFMLIGALLSAAFCIKVFTDLKINYIFIMELNPHYKITHIQLLRVSVILFTIWAFCLLGQISIIKLDAFFEEPQAVFTLAALILVVFLCIIPWHCFYKTARLEMLSIFWQVIASPFYVVRFKQFLLADIITSFVNPLKDLGHVVCFFTTGLWL